MRHFAAPCGRTALPISNRTIPTEQDIRKQHNDFVCVWSPSVVRGSRHKSNSHAEITRRYNRLSFRCQQAATTGHTRKLRTPVASFEFLQLKPDMFAHGIEWSDSPQPFRIAMPEKALLDTLYISTRKHRRFSRLPELHLQDAGFSARRYRALMKKHALSRPISAAMQRKLERALA